MKRSKDMQKTIDTIAKSLFGRSNTEAIHARQCVTCGAEATEFRDKLSMKEYRVSGMCQACQDSVFG